MPLPTWIKLPDSATGLAARSDLAAVASKDTQATVAAENAPLRIVYGRARLGAQIANVLVYQTKLVVQAVWCEGEIDAISSVTLNNETLPVGVTATHYTGTAGQTVNSTLVAAFAAIGIVYTDALPGIAYSVFQIPASASAGFPGFEAIIRGRKVYDPRVPTTAWSDNPALCLADFIASDVYGLGRTVDSASIGTVADDCDALVGGIARRRLGLVIDATAPTRQHVEAMRAYAGCWVVDTGAGLKLVSDRPRSTDHTITAADVVAGSLRLTQLGVRDAPTVVVVRYTDTTTTPWADKTATAKASGVDTGAVPRRESEVPLPGVQTYAQAYREAVERLNHFLLENISAEWRQFDEALKVEPGDVVSLTHPIGLTSKLLRVTEAKAESAGRWAIKAREYDPAAYSDLVASEPSYADTSLPSPAAPPVLTGLTATEEVYQLENGTYASRIKLAWTAADYPYIDHYRVEIYVLGELVATATARESIYRTGAVQEAASYTCKVAAVTSIGAVGLWAQTGITPAGKYLAPGNVPSVTVFEVGGEVMISWAPAVDLDIWRYEVRYGVSSGAWADATLIDRVDALRLSSTQIPVGTWDIHVKALDSVGQYSAAAAVASVTVTSDASAFLVDSYDSTTPTLTNMASYTLAPSDSSVYYVTEDAVAFGTKYSSTLDTYSDALATYHSSLTSTWLGEAEDFGQVLGGQWTGTATVAALSGSLLSYLGISADGSSWSYTTGLSRKDNGRFGRIKHESLTTSTLQVVVPAQNIRLDAIPREEVGTGTSSATLATTITLGNEYVAVKKITITPEGATARMAVFDNIVLGSPSTFDVYVFDAAGAQIASDFYYAFQGV